MENQVCSSTAKNSWLDDYWRVVRGCWFEQDAKKNDGKGIKIPQVKNIIFNDPATIVYWQDGTKTVVKTMHGDTFNEEYGVAMAYMKKIFGSSTGFKKLVTKYKPEVKKIEKEKDNTQNIFQVGSRVIAIANVDSGLDNNEYRIKNEPGTIRSIGEEDCVVEFDNDVGGWNDENRNIEGGHGLWVDYTNLKLINS
jgi:hypothetical protein